MSVRSKIAQTTEAQFQAYLPSLRQDDKSTAILEKDQGTALGKQNLQAKEQRPRGPASQRQKPGLKE